MPATAPAAPFLPFARSGVSLRPGLFFGVHVKFIFIPRMLNRWIYITGAAAIFVYLIIRACTVPPVHDEAATYLHYIQRNEWMPYHAHWDANNHILNSFLSSLIFKLFGQGLLPLRLASLLFFPVFAFFTWKLSHHVKTNWLRGLFLVSMLMVHNLVEYFGYSRGYAMSMALLMGSLHFLFKYLVHGQLKKLAPFYLFSFLAIAANLTLITVVMLMNILLAISFVRNKQFIFLKTIYLLLGAMPVIMAAALSMDMKALGLLYYGSDKGFWQVTIHSLVILIYDVWSAPVALFFCIYAALALFLMCAIFIREKTWSMVVTPMGAAGFLFIGSIAGIIVMQKLLHVNYPEDRTAMYLYFLLVIFLFIVASHSPRLWLKIVCTGWLLVPVHFFMQINFTNSAYWYYEHLPRRFYEEVEKRAGPHPENVSVGGYVLMDLIWAYYNQQNEGKLNDMQVTDYPSFYYDFLLLYDDHNLQYARQFYNIIDVDPFSGIHLLERKDRLRSTLIMSYSLPDLVHDTLEYHNLWENDSLKKYPNLRFNIEADFKNSDPFFFGMFTVAVNELGTEVKHENQEFHFFRTQWNKGYTLRHGLWIQGVRPATDRIVLYFWNPRHVPIDLTHIKVNIYSFY